MKVHQAKPQPSAGGFLDPKALLNPKAIGVAVAAGLIGNQISMRNSIAAKDQALDRSRKLTSADVIIVGAGISGICMAIKLQEAGIPYTMIEKNAGFGGTWFLNRYPGCACDIPAHLYSYSFERKMDWSEPYAPQEEIRQYLDGVAQKYELDRHTVFNCGLKTADWNEATGRWDVVTTTGATYNPRFLINAIGGLHHPSFPNVPGMDLFKGPSCHSAEWNEGMDLKGKRVAIIGSAASAVQLVPHVAKVASDLYIVQRTPNWVASRFHPLLPRGKYSDFNKWVYKNVPLTEKIHRFGIYLTFEAAFWPLGVFDKAGLGQNLAQYLIRWEMCHNLKNDPELIDKIVPKYGIGCKRICRTDDYLPTLTQKNVHVVAGGLKEVGEDFIVASNGERVDNVDVIIYATGFQVGSVGKECAIRGKGANVMTGSSAADSASESYLGMTAPEYPNSFMLLGPNTGLGHNSIILMIESQAQYITRMMSEALDNDIGTFEIKKPIVDKYYKWIWNEFEDRVWQHGGCQSWYKNADGKIFSLWPSTTTSYFKMCDEAPSLRDSYTCKPLDRSRPQGQLKSSL